MNYRLLSIISILLWSFFISTVSAQSWVYPSDMGANYTDGHFNKVFFSSPSIGFAVGGELYEAYSPSSKMLRTTDGGQTWKDVPLKLKHQITGLYFSDVATGYFVARDSPNVANTMPKAYIYQTKDTGKTWTLRYTKDTSWLFDIRFLNKFIGIAVEAIGICKTDDEGMTWKYIQITGIGGGPNTGIRRVTVSDDAIFLVGGSGLHRSLDDGETWVKLSNLNSTCIQAMDSFLFIGRNSGGLTRVGKNSATGSWPVVINNSEKFADVKFQDNIGIAVTISGRIFRSSDRGASWSEVTPKQNTRLNSIAFAGSKILVVGDSAGMVISQDNGQSFQQPFIMQNGTWVQRVQYRSKSEIYFIQNKSVFKSIDAGRTWEKLSYNFPNKLYAMAVVGNTDIYVGDDKGNIYRSTSNGSSWTKQTTNSTAWIYDIHFIDNNTGMAVGNQGEILKTTNSGSTWTKQPVSASPNSFFNRSHFFNTQKGWVVGDTGVLIGTTNGGSSWIKVNLSTTDYLLDISFYDDNNGFAVGSNGAMYRTIDAGVNWTRKNLGTTNTIYAIDFTGSKNGWCAGADGLLMRTTDGGENWQVQSTTHHLSYSGIHFFDSVSGILGGGNGMIQLYTCFAEKPVAKDTLGFKSGDKLSNLAVSGSQLTWYSAASGGNVLPNSNDVVDKTFYYVTQRIGACESDRRKVYTLLNANVVIVDLESELFQLKYEGNSLIINKEVNATVSMYELTGKIVYSTQEKLSEINIDVVDFNSGVYIIQLSNSNKTTTKKIFIE